MSKAKEAQVHVLLVDDDENILLSIQRLLMSEPLDLLTATSGEEGLELLRKNPGIGIIISDQRMGGMTGVEFLEQAWDIAPDSIRMMLTGYDDMSIANGAINKGGAYRYITKPWKNSEFVQALHDAAKIYTLIQENKRLTGIIRRMNGFTKNGKTRPI